MSELPKRELALAGAACAVCWPPLMIGAIAAAPGVAVVGGGMAVAAAVVRRVRRKAAGSNRQP